MRKYEKDHHHRRWMGGLAAGIYGQLNGFDTTIFEAHSLPGGQCTSWRRKGYVFDGCMQYFGGAGPQIKVETCRRGKQGLKSGGL